MNIMKKGLDNLFVTFLIVSFTIIVTIAVLVWVKNYTVDLKEQTEDISSQRIYCLNNINFEITNACYIDDSVKVTLSNNANLDLEGFLIRSYKNLDEVYPNEIDYKIEKFKIDSFKYSSEANIKFIEIVAKVKLNNKVISCSQDIKSFGNLNDQSLSLC